MKRLHMAISTDAIEETIEDYSQRLQCRPCVVVPGEYALWRTDILNLSVRKDDACMPGELRHLGWEDPAIDKFSIDRDINGIIWEHFTAQQQADEIEAVWPGMGYQPK